MKQINKNDVMHAQEKRINELNELEWFVSKVGVFFEVDFAKIKLKKLENSSTQKYIMYEWPSGPGTGQFYKYEFRGYYAYLNRYLNL